MGEKAVSIISSIAIINLLVTSLVCWFKSKNHRFYLWLGWIIFSSAIAMINNLHIFLDYGNIWFNHFSLLINVSFGAYIILFIRNHTKKPTNKFSQNLLLFIPSFLYIPFIIFCIVYPAWAEKTIEFAEKGELTIFSILFNLIIVFYSVGANLWLFIKEIRNRKVEHEISTRNQRIEILGVMLALQLMAFVPFLLKTDINYVIVYMPVFGQIYFLYLFLRMWKLDRVNLSENEKIHKSSADNTLKYATIRLSDDKIERIKNQINELMESEKLYLIPEFSLTDLSNKTGVTTYILSMVINSQLQTNFSDLINKFRVEKAKLLLPVMKMNKSTIETIAYDCGFSNRTSFYAAFRKFTNQSPSNYIKDIEKGNLSVG